MTGPIFNILAPHTIKLFLLVPCVSNEKFIIGLNYKKVLSALRVNVIYYILHYLYVLSGITDPEQSESLSNSKVKTLNTSYDFIWSGSYVYVILLICFMTLLFLFII